MSAFRIFSRFAELLDIKAARSEAAWPRLNADGTVDQLTATQTRTALYAASQGDVLPIMRASYAGSPAQQDGTISVTADFGDGPTAYTLYRTAAIATNQAWWSSDGSATDPGSGEWVYLEPGRPPVTPSPYWQLIRHVDGATVSSITAGNYKNNVLTATWPGEVTSISGDSTIIPEEPALIGQRCFVGDYDPGNGKRLEYTSHDGVTWNLTGPACVRENPNTPGAYIELTIDADGAPSWTPYTLI